MTAKATITKAELCRLASAANEHNVCIEKGEGADKIRVIPAAMLPADTKALAPRKVIPL